MWEGYTSYVPQISHTISDHWIIIFKGALRIRSEFRNFKDAALHFFLKGCGPLEQYLRLQPVSPGSASRRYCLCRELVAEQGDITGCS